VPIFILDRHKSGVDPNWPLVTYLPDVETAMARAKEAAASSSTSAPTTSSWSRSGS
jgi:hypothetical protein